MGLHRLDQSASWFVRLCCTRYDRTESGLDQGTVIVAPVPNGPGDWKSTEQSELLPAPPFTLHPAPSRAKNSTSYAPDGTGPITTVKDPLPWMLLKREKISFSY